MATKDVKDFVDTTYPTFGFYVSALGAVMYWLFLPVTFILGAAWQGIVTGFKLGRYWGGEE